MKRQVVAAGKLRRDVVMKMRGKGGYNNGSVISPGAAWLPDILGRIPAGRSRAADAVHRASRPVAKNRSTKNNPRSAPSIAVGLVGGVARANLDLVVQYIV